MSAPSPRPYAARLLLASASPARLATLRAAGIEPVVRVSSVEEELAVERARTRVAPEVLLPQDVALLLARAKAEDVAASVASSEEWGGLLVLGCDSVLELDGEIHGKPAGAAEAIDRWRRMRGRSGVLHTGHWLIDTRDPDSGGGSAGQVGAVASTVVHFAVLRDAEIEAYVATGEPLRVAGAFTIDGLGGAFVTALEGDHTNVVGVSLPTLRDLLGQLDVDWFALAASATPSAAEP